jgi:hypothetical protein
LREANILAVLDGRKTFLFGKERRAAGEVAAMAGALRDALDGLRHGLPRPLKEELTIPAVCLFTPDEEVPDKLLGVLRWHLAADEELVALADARLQGWWSGSVYVAATDRRLLVAKQGDILDKGLIEQDIPLTEVRYVRYTRGTRKDSPTLSVFTPADDLRFEFGSWAKGDSAQEPIDEFAQILTDAINVPETERVIARSRTARAALQTKAEPGRDAMPGQQRSSSD